MNSEIHEVEMQIAEMKKRMWFMERGDDSYYSNGGFKHDDAILRQLQNKLFDLKGA